MLETVCCVDCALYHANYDMSSLSDAEACRLVTAIEETLSDEWHVAIGDTVADFSTERCESCGSTLGGARFSMTLFT